METKGVRQKLKQLLCKLLGCEELYQPQPELRKHGNIEFFEYDGYEVETQIFSAQSLILRLYLKGTLVFAVYCADDHKVEWAYGQHYPSYKVRKYMQEYASKRQSQLREKI